MNGRNAVVTIENCTGQALDDIVAERIWLLSQKIDGVNGLLGHSEPCKAEISLKFAGTIGGKKDVPVLGLAGVHDSLP